MACLYCPWPVLNCHLLQNHSNKTKNNLSDKIKSMFIFRSQNYKYSRASFCKLRDGAGLTVIKHFQLEFSLKWKFVPWELDFGIARIEKHQDFNTLSDWQVSELMIPTDETARQMFFLEAFLTHGKPLLFIGPTGTGKSAITNNYIVRMPKEK